MTIDHINRISEETNSILRNLQITQCYHDLSAEFAHIVDSKNANWCTFATWASKTAGKSIRDEELPRFILDFLRDEARLRPKLGPVLVWIYQRTGSKVDLAQQIRSTIQEVSKEVAEGNLKVFAELAPLFMRFTKLLSEPQKNWNVNFSNFIEGLKPGPTAQGGQELLKQAFTNYAVAARESKAKKKAELMLLANCQIGLHEQTRLQDDIQGAMDAPVVMIITDGLGRLLVIRLAFTLLAPFGVSRELVRANLQIEWQQVATRFSMNLSLPDGRVLPLGGNNIPWPNQIPEILHVLTHPELITFLQQYDDNLDQLRINGAANWSRLGDRMGFICELFRSSQQDENLFDQPFSHKAQEEIARGNIPMDGI